MKRLYFLTIFLLVFIFFISGTGIRKVKVIKLPELYTSDGRFVVFGKRIISYEPKTFTLKSFDLSGKLIGKKVIKGEGPGEISASLGTYIVPFRKNTFLIIESIKKRWVKYDKNLNYLGEGFLPSSVTVLKAWGNVIVGGDVGMGKDYTLKISLVSKDLKSSKVIFSGDVGKFTGKIDPNSTFVSLDLFGNLIVFGYGNGNKITLINTSGKVVKDVKLPEINPSSYSEKEKEEMMSQLPSNVRNYFVIDKYPKIFQVLFHGKDEIVVVTGERKKSGFRGFLYNLRSGNVKEFILPETDNLFLKQGGNYWGIKEGDDGCIITVFKIEE